VRARPIPARQFDRCGAWAPFDQCIALLESGDVDGLGLALDAVPDDVVVLDLDEEMPEVDRMAIALKMDTYTPNGRNRAKDCTSSASRGRTVPAAIRAVRRLRDRQARLLGRDGVLSSRRPETGGRPMAQALVSG
jgi:hypothetical protein